MVVPPPAAIALTFVLRSSKLIELTFCKGMITSEKELKTTRLKASVGLILEKNINIAYLAN